MRAIKKFKNLMFTLHESVWWIVSELEDWLYPYKDRLTPEDRFEVRVKDPLSGDMYMVCLLYTSPSPRDDGVSRMPSSA